MKALKNLIAILILAAVITSTVVAQSSTKGKPLNSAEVASLRNQLKELTKSNELISEYLTKFDTLDFKVFSNQQWVRLHESHAKDIVVHWPDGHFTHGIERHIEDLKAMFVYAPNTNIKEHPVRFGSGNFTAVIGVMTGTFSKPMPIGNGQYIQPTGKSFKLPMCTIGIWKDGVMTEEYLFWDNQTYMNQIGLGK